MKAVAAVGGGAGVGVAVGGGCQSSGLQSHSFHLRYGLACSALRGSWPICAGFKISPARHLRTHQPPSKPPTPDSRNRGIAPLKDPARGLLLYLLRKSLHVSRLLINTSRDIGNLRKKCKRVEASLTVLVIPYILHFQTMFVLTGSRLCELANQAIATYMLCGLVSKLTVNN